MIFAKESIEISFCDELNRENARSKDSLWVWVKIGKEKILVGCVYRKGTSAPENNRRLEENIRRARGLSEKVLIHGDFNFPETDWANKFVPIEERHVEASSFLETIEDSFMSQHVMENTRVRGQHNPSCLDLILSESKESIVEIKYRAPLGSGDHCIITWKYVVDVDFEVSKFRRKCYYRGDYERMRGLLGEIDWEAELAGLPLNDAYNRFREIILNVTQPLSESRMNWIHDPAPPAPRRATLDCSDTLVRSIDNPVQSRDTHVNSRDPPVLTSDTQASAIAIRASSRAPLALSHPKKSRRRRNRRSANENSAPRSATPVTRMSAGPIGIQHSRERPSINQRPVTPPR